MISRLRREMQIARLPWQTESSASIKTEAMPWRASPRAVDSPTGPPPTMATLWRVASIPASRGGMRAGYCRAVNG